MDIRVGGKILRYQFSGDPCNNAVFTPFSCVLGQIQRCPEGQVWKGAVLGEQFRVRRSIRNREGSRRSRIDRQKMGVIAKERRSFQFQKKVRKFLGVFWSTETAFLPGQPWAANKSAWQRVHNVFRFVGITEQC